MIEVSLKNFLDKGKIKKQPAGFIQAEKMLKEALIDLAEAKKTLGVSKRGAYLLAYNAMLKAGRALMLIEGYVPDDGGQHKTVVEFAGLILGGQFKNIIKKFENMRRKRNELTYEAGVLLSATETKSALDEANALIAGILDKIKTINPQLELKFKV